MKLYELHEGHWQKREDDEPIRFTSHAKNYNKYISKWSKKPKRMKKVNK